MRHHTVFLLFATFELSLVSAKQIALCIICLCGPLATARQTEGFCVLGWEFFSSPLPRPDRLWDPPNLLSSGY